MKQRFNSKFQDKATSTFDDKHNDWSRAHRFLQSPCFDIVDYYLITPPNNLESVSECALAMACVPCDRRYQLA